MVADRWPGCKELVKMEKSISLDVDVIDISMQVDSIMKRNFILMKF
jgi:hypothetical protein